MSKCTDCNEYNHEKHYCPKFCDVIRNTTKEMQEYYKGEHKKLERIKQIVNEWKENVEWDIEMHDTLEKITKVLEQE